MNQGKLEVGKQEMATVNINILGISELKWTGMGEFNSDDHYICYCGQESLRRNGVAIRVNKSPKSSTWMQSQKGQNDLCSFPRETIHITGIQVYAPTSNAEDVEQFYEDPHELLELAQIHVHSFGDTIQPSHPLSFPSPPAFNVSQHQKHQFFGSQPSLWSNSHIHT